MSYTKTTWNHGDIITAAGLNHIETALEDLSNNTCNDTTNYNFTSNQPGANNKIATMESISATITSLTSTLTISNSAVAEGQEYRTIVTAITETAGKLTTAETTVIPIASSTTFGLVKVSSNLTIDGNGLLKGNYGIDNSGGVAYSSKDNKLATVNTVKYFIGESINTLESVTGYNDNQLTIINVNSSSAGTITCQRAAISINKDQIRDLTYASATNESTYTLTTVGKVNELIGAITATISGTASAENTITSFSQTNGAINVTFAPIAISASQVNGTATTATNGLMSSSDKIKLDAITTMASLTEEQQAERDAATANDQPWTDPRSPGLIDPADKDLLDEASIVSTLFFSNFVITSGNVTGIKVYNAAGTSYKVLTYDEITATAVSVGE